jgi:S-adenosylmethionine decarboxylase
LRNFLQEPKTMTIKTKRSIQWVHIKEKEYAGLHLIAEFWGARDIEDEKEIKQILIGAAKSSGCRPLKVSTYKFKPRGVTGVVLLAESHISIHAWPEHDYLAIDLFTCGDKKRPQAALDYLKEIYKPKRVESRKIMRGNFSKK